MYIRWAHLQENPHRRMMITHREHTVYIRAYTWNVYILLYRTRETERERKNGRASGSTRLESVVWFTGSRDEHERNVTRA